MQYGVKVSNVKKIKTEFISVIRSHKNILLCMLFMQYVQNPNFFPHLLGNFTEIFRHFLQRTPRTESNDLIMLTAVYTHIKNILELVLR